MFPENIYYNIYNIYSCHLNILRNRNVVVYLNIYLLGKQLGKDLVGKV